MTNTASQVKIDINLINSCQNNVGKKQGEDLAPILFDLVLEHL